MWKIVSGPVSSFFLSIVIGSGFWICVCTQSSGQSWKTGGAFREALNQKVKFSSNGILKDDLGGLSRNSRVAIFLDPEIDPSQKIPFPTNLQPLGKTIDEVAVKIDALAINVGSFVYIGPREKVLRLLVLRNHQAYRFSNLSAAIQKMVGEVSGFGWNFLSAPRDTLAVLFSNLGLKIQNIDLIPHDLWSANQLPRLAKWEQATFLLSTLGLTFVIDEDSMVVQILELGDSQLLTLRYRKSDQRKIEQIISNRKLGQSRTVVRGNDLFVRGPIAELKSISQDLIPERKWKTAVKSGSRDVFNLNTTASRGQILATIAKNRGVDLKFSQELEQILKQRITIDVKKATVNELVEAALNTTGLRFRLTPTHLWITK
jgi:hypothetical protein